MFQGSIYRIDPLVTGLGKISPLLGDNAMATVTRDELVSILMKRKGATIVSIDADTDARLRKKGNPHGSCRKLTSLVGMIGWNYSNSINNQRAREGHTGHFTAEPRAWGTRIEGTPLVEHNGNYYLEVKVERILEVTYVRDLDGNVVDYGDIEFFLPPKRVNERAETEKNIYPTDYAIENIKRIKLDGVLYEVVAA